MGYLHSHLVLFNFFGLEMIRTHISQTLTVGLLIGIKILTKYITVPLICFVWSNKFSETFKLNKYAIAV